jgi:hypothetical protein
MKRCIYGVLTLSLLLLGCESKFNHRNFQMIEIGADDAEDVRQILGKPTSAMGDVWYYDKSGEHTASIFFDDDGRVVNKEWMGAVTGDWEGKNPYTDERPQGEIRESHKKTRRIDKD